MEINIDLRKIKDWNSFHEVFSNVMGFPDFYGKNNNAWVDCMSYIDDKEAGMSKFTVDPGESLNMLVSGVEESVQLAPEILLGFIEIVADVNKRFIEADSETRLNIIAT